MAHITGDIRHLSNNGMKESDDEMAEICMHFVWRG